MSQSTPVPWRDSSEMRLYLGVSFFGTYVVGHKAVRSLEDFEDTHDLSNTGPIDPRFV